MVDHDENKVPEENLTEEQAEPTPEVTITLEAPVQPVHPTAPQRDQVDIYVREAKNLLKASWNYGKKLAKEPMSAMTEALPLTSAIFFAALQPIALFLLIRVIAGQLLGLIPFGFGAFLAPTFGQWVQLFFLTILYYALYLFLLMVLAVVFGKLICKAHIDLKLLFTQTVAAHIPLTAALLGAMIFVVFGMGLASGFFMSIALAILLVGGVATYILLAKAITFALKINENKGFYVTLAAYGVLLVVAMLFVI